ncbi:hypothetical protein RISK_002867 [Rhodopirellula islandica]|uniref:Uncharacterized protein n=1 Tax=Rhodopirellula islandica TaxID=595434 RepID=A0A0J1BEZ6_RHOIS|nr:hypothetical protein RISK_002867 [Rhodopirellula islandica]
MLRWDESPGWRGVQTEGILAGSPCGAALLKLRGIAVKSI